MKILCVADIHGRKEVLDSAIRRFEAGGFDLFLQMGDIEDSHDRSDADIKYCLERIMEFKKDNSGKVVLLLGNHAGNYLPFGTICSGLRPSMQRYIERYYMTHLKEFQIAWSFKYHLITHAGVGRLWLKNAQKLLGTATFPDRNAAYEIADWLNNLMFTEAADCLFEVGVESGGSAPQGGPTWLRPAEAFCHDILPEIHQIVGHTPQKNIRTIREFRYSGPVTDRSLTLIDVLGTDPDGFYELEI